MEKLQFGDVFTNDINHWMVVSAGKPSCEQCGAIGWGGTMISLLIKDGKPYAFSGYPQDKKPSDIQPYARYVGRMELAAPKEKETPPSEEQS